MNAIMWGVFMDMNMIKQPKHVLVNLDGTVICVTKVSLKSVMFFKCKIDLNECIIRILVSKQKLCSEGHRVCRWGEEDMDVTMSKCNKRNLQTHTSLSLCRH